MKTIFKTISIITLFVLCSCADWLSLEPVELKVDCTNLEFAATSQTRNISIQAAERPIVILPGWLTGDTSNIPNADNKWSVKIVCKANSTAESRKGRIEIRCQNDFKYITVTQQAGNVIDDGNQNPDIQDPSDDKEEPDDGDEDKEEKPSDQPSEDNGGNGNDNPDAPETPEDPETPQDPEPAVPAEVSPIDILKAVWYQNFFYDVEETEDYISVFFYDPQPFTVQKICPDGTFFAKEYPNGIESLDIPKELLTGYTDDVDVLTFRLLTGKEVRLYAAPIPTELICDVQKIYMVRWTEDGKDTYESVTFSVKGFRPNLMAVNLETKNFKEHVNDINLTKNNDNTFTLQLKSSLLDDTPNPTKDDIKGDNIYFNVSWKNKKTDRISIRTNVYYNYTGLDTEAKTNLRNALIDFYHACLAEGRPDTWKDYKGDFHENLDNFECVYYDIFQQENEPPLRLVTLNLGGPGASGLIPDSFWSNLTYCRAVSIALDSDSPRTDIPSDYYWPYLEDITLEYVDPDDWIIIGIK